MREPRRPKLRVPVEAPGEAEWERMERRLEAARGEELAAAPVADLRRGSRRLALVTVLAVGVAAGMALMAWRAEVPARAPETAAVAAPAEAAAAAPTLPTRVVTPPGGASRLALGDAVVDVGPDAELSVETAPGGAITVQLVRGAVDCDVEPRPGRAPFHVHAADVTVTVVGTRFVVDRRAGGDAVRVQVTRGKVKVADGAHGAELQVAAGQEWDAARGLVASAAAPAPVAAPVDAGPRAPAAASVSDASPRLDPTQPPTASLAEARSLEASDPDAAAARYRQLAQAAAASDPPIAEGAAWRVAALEYSRSRWDASLEAARAYEQAFAHGAHLEDVLWLRVQASCGAYRSRAAEAAARAYLAKFPEGRHAASARSSAVCAR